MSAVDQKRKVDAIKMNNKELELAETIYIRDIENKVFQGIVLQCLATIEGIVPVEGGFIDNIFGRGALESAKGIVAEQDSKSQAVKIKVEVNIYYGYSIPEKAEEIQTKITECITNLCGLHVASVHVVFKNIVPADYPKKLIDPLHASLSKESHSLLSGKLEEEYSEEY